LLQTLFGNINENRNNPRSLSRGRRRMGNTHHHRFPVFV